MTDSNQPIRPARHARWLPVLLAATMTVACAIQASALEITDATGRSVAVPDQVRRVLPAGPPAAVLLAAIAPDLSMGVIDPLGEAAKAALPPAVAALPVVPRLTGGKDNSGAVAALHPDLIVDYGNTAPRYQQTARNTQDKTGIPVLLFDGALDKIPAVTRTLGRILHQTERAEVVARLAEAILALPLPADSHPKVLYARGAEGTLAAAPNTDVTAVFTALGWQVVAPASGGTFRPTDPDAIRALDPDVVILADPAARHLLSTPAWTSIRAVREGHAIIAPSVPFGWIEEPPSINRLLGLAWLRGGDPLTLAAVFNADVYGRVLTRDRLLSIAGAAPTMPGNRTDASASRH